MKLMTITAVTVLALAFGSDVRAQSGPYQYFSLTPCRVVDTRGPAGTNGGPIMGTTKRDFAVRGTCGVPTTAKAVSINVTIQGASAASWLTLWPSGQAQPYVSTINFDSGNWALANGALVGLSTNTKDLSVANASGTVHVIIDVNGYYQ